MNFTVIDSEEKMRGLHFDKIEQITLVLHHDTVSMTNRTLGWIAGKEKVLDQIGMNVEAFRAKKRIVDLRLISPPSGNFPSMIIQIEEWWEEVLRRHVRHLIFDETKIHYIKSVLGAIPKQHAIQRMTLSGIIGDVTPLFPHLRSEQLAFLDCHWGVPQIRKLLEVPRARLAHLFLTGIVLGKSPFDAEDETIVHENMKSIISIIIRYFQQYMSKSVDKDKDLVSHVNEFRVDLQCNVPYNIQLPSFLLPHSLFVKVNGALQEMDEPEESTSEEEAEEHSKKRQRQESSEEQVEEEDQTVHNITKWMEQEDVVRPEEEEEEEEVIEMEEIEEPIKVPKKKEKKEKSDEKHWRALEHMFGTDRVQKMNVLDPFTKSLAKAASKARAVTCADCKKQVSFRDLSSHKQLCKREMEWEQRRLLQKQVAN